MSSFNILYCTLLLSKYSVSSYSHGFFWFLIPKNPIVASFLETKKLLSNKSKNNNSSKISPNSEGSTLTIWLKWYDKNLHVFYHMIINPLAKFKKHNLSVSTTHKIMRMSLWFRWEKFSAIFKKENSGKAVKLPFSRNSKGSQIPSSPSPKLLRMDPISREWFIGNHPKKLKLPNKFEFNQCHKKVCSRFSKTHKWNTNKSLMKSKTLSLSKKTSRCSIILKRANSFTKHTTDWISTHTST